MGKIKKILIVIVALVLVYYAFSFRQIPTKIDYGVSFSKFHSDELKLDWKTVYLAILDDLKIKNLRLSAHWPMIEPTKGKYDFSVLDYQMEEAKKRDVSVILAIGRRLPGWPECHEPDWTVNTSEADKRIYILDNIKTIVERYKDYSNLKYWQVENEPFLGFFGRSHCQNPDESFLKEEIALVKKIDSNHKVLVTDSGEFGTWYQAYRDSDVFGSSIYLYVWSAWFGPIRYPIGPSFFRVKENIMDLVYGWKPKVLIELSSEPWLLHPIVETSLDVQLQQMNINRFKESIDFAKKSGFDSQYLWGAEWWYWLKTQQNHSEFWDEAKSIFKSL